LRYGAGSRFLARARTNSSVSWQDRIQPNEGRKVIIDECERETETQLLSEVRIETKSEAASLPVYRSGRPA
jgi:hypothetical protein